MGLLIGQCLFHSQTLLPGWAVYVPPCPPFLGACVVVAAALGLLLYSRGLVLFVLAMLVGFAGTLPQANWHLNHRLALQCHGEVIHADFELLSAAVAVDGSARWRIQIEKGTGPCLHTGTVLWLQNTPIANPDFGAVYRARLVLKPPHAPLQLSGFDPNARWFADGIGGFSKARGGVELVSSNAWTHTKGLLQQARWTIEQWVIHVLGATPQAGLVLALTVGEQGLIDATTRDLFANTGIAHLIAISGLHIGLMAAMAAWLVRRLFSQTAWLARRTNPHAVACFTACLAAFCYCLLTGWGVPAQRALIMLAALIVSQTTTGRANPWDCLWLALCASLLLDPWACQRTGLYLSFTAVFALVVVSHGVYRFPRPRFEKLRQGLRAQWAVTTALFVPCCVLFNQQSLVSPLVNTLSIAWMSLLTTPLALAGSLLHSATALHLAAFTLQVQDHWLNAFNALGWATLAVPDQPLLIVVLAGLGGLICLFPLGWKGQYTGLALMALMLWPAPRPEDGGFTLNVLDIGQGTALAIDTAQHRLLFDTGPAFSAESDSGRRVLAPWLRQHGTKPFDALWVSHNDSDHSGGAPYVLTHFNPAVFVNSMPADNPLNEQARQRQIPTGYCHSMKPWQWDGVLFEPLPLWQSAHPIVPKGDNNQSCVLKISNSRHSVLLTGDIEAPAERALIEKYGPKRLTSEMLISPHHGSKTSSTPAFLNAVSPHFIVIESGWKNHYHHPAPETIDKYKRTGALLFNTAQLGALQFTFPATGQAVVFNIAGEVRKRYWSLHESSANVAVHW